MRGMLRSHPVVVAELLIVWCFDSTLPAQPHHYTLVRHGVSNQEDDRQSLRPIATDG